MICSWLGLRLEHEEVETKAKDIKTFGRRNGMGGLRWEIMKLFFFSIVGNPFVVLPNQMLQIYNDA